MPRCIVAAVALALAGCTTNVPAPETVEQPARAYQAVPFPPPPARPEFVPEQPDPSAVWIDGEWRWRGLRWGWIYGRWVKPPPNAAWAPPSWKRAADGRLLVAPGTWRDERGRPVPHPPALELANSDEGDVIEDEGLLEDVAPNQRARETERGIEASGCELDRPLATESR